MNFEQKYNDLQQKYINLCEMYFFNVFIKNKEQQIERTLYMDIFQTNY
jgi:hypothetical protein